MHTYVALLRGINVGGNNKIDMATLRTLCEGLGFTQVTTYINSGNVLFKTHLKDEKRIATTLEDAIRKHYNLTIPVVVRSKRTITQLVNAIPNEWTNDTNYKTDVFFLFPGYDSKKSLTLLPALSPVDTVQYTARSIIWHIRKKNYNKSALNDIVGTEVYKNSTVRNSNTVRTLAKRMAQM